MERLASGNSTVDAMGTLNLSGNIVPQIWYKTITKETGKPYLLAITLLADIVYWYRPAEIRDEASGQITGWHKKFKGELLQKTYQQYADLFGESKRTIKAALDRLEEIGVIKKEFRDIECENGITLYNLMYIDLNVDKLVKLTYPNMEEKYSSLQGSVPPPTKNCTTPLQKFVGGDTVNCSSPCEKKQEEIQEKAGGHTENADTPVQKIVPPHTEICGTNTYITTKNTDIDYNNPINQSEEAADNPTGQSHDSRIDVIDMTNETGAYMALIRDNLEYEHHMKYDSSSDREMFEEIYETVCDIVCVKRNTIRINGEEYPYELVRSRFLKLNSSHVLYVMDRMRDTVTKITNIRSYLITTLYNAPSTMNHYYQQEVQYDMYGGGWERKGVR